MDILDVLRAQDGCIHRDQALRCGLSPSAIARLLGSHRWTEAAPRVYRATDHPATPRARLRAAGLWLGEDGTLIGTAGAAWWHLDETVPSTIRGAVPPGRSGRAPEGVSVRRRALADEDRLRVDGVWVTRRPLTVLDAAADLGLVDGARLMDRSLQRGAVALDDLRAVHERTAGRWGTTLGRTLLDLAEGGARSEAERRTATALRQAGIHGWVANHEVFLPGWGPVVLDLAFRAQRVAIEVDGWAFHRDVDRFRADARRGNEVVIGGWRLLRVTWYDLQEDPARFVDMVRRAVCTPPALAG